MTTWWIVLLICCWGTVLLLATTVLGLMRRLQQLEAGPTRTQGTGALTRGPQIGAKLTETPGLTSGPGIDASGILLFLSSTCGACIRLADALRESGNPGLLDPKVVSLVTDTDGESAFADLDVAQMIVQQAGEVVRSLGVPATPYAIAVSTTGTVVDAGLASDLDALVGIAKSLGVEALSA